ncbi:helix-turn-helix domain-containing protein [Pseudomonas sp. P5_152]|uniref:helix-turn-helix transcriptional regulator n=1 Tax=Pseudomonas sp. P5_152 TaxID=3043442 RepID=UPI002A36B8A8|nr:helix-turn-helix domain-containing protein [Pseudomonas sp. P5_152]MDX9668415.1 helix-turn-helix domain-containing protein [Pseudomonas sp. P5_152]
MNHSAPIAIRARNLQPGLELQATGQLQGITLTNREKEVLLWSAKGKSSWEIGQIVNCSESGVNYHFGNIRRKFGVSSRWTAVFKALEQGLIQLS